jgi:hypothetical protein
MAPEQVQIFTPTPSTYATLMYWTGRDPFSAEKIFVEKDPVRKQRQKAEILPRRSRGGINPQSQRRQGHASASPRRQKR